MLECIKLLSGFFIILQRSFPPYFFPFVKISSRFRIMIAKNSKWRRKSSFGNRLSERNCWRGKTIKNDNLPVLFKCWKCNNGNWIFDDLHIGSRIRCKSWETLKIICTPVDCYILITFQTKIFIFHAYYEIPIQHYSKILSLHSQSTNFRNYVQKCFRIQFLMFYFVDKCLQFTIRNSVD